MSVGQIAPWDIYIGTTGPHDASDWTQINGTSKGAASAFTRYADWLPGGPLRFVSPSDPVGQRPGALLRSTDVYSEMRSGTLRLVSKYTGADTGSDLKAEMMDEWATLIGSLVNPADGEIYLRFDRANRSGTTLSNVLICRVAGVPEYQPQFFEESAQPIIDVGVELEVLYPYYVDRTGSSQAYANATATPASNALSNSGHTDAVGMRVVVDAVDSGTPTVLTVDNTTTGKTLEMTVATTLTAGDEWSWFASDPRKIAVSTTNASNFSTMAADDDGFLARGSNTVQVSVDSGQADITIYWYPERYTP